MRVELRQHSVAAIVLDASVSPSKASRRALARAMAEGGLASVVLGTSASQRGLVGAALLALAVALHAVAALAALASQGRHGARLAATRPSLRIDHFVDVEPPEPPPPPPAAPPPVKKARAVERLPNLEPPSPTPPSEAPPPPAEAAQVVEADESAPQPLDFTAFDVPTGKGQRYAGGSTASSGTSSGAVHTPVVDHGAAPNERAGTSRAHPVGPPRRDWDCPWPAEADALSVDEQVVVIRAVVRADGTVGAAELVSDPGYGFGQIALACARQQRFPAATDDQGRPITATSPPIRVRFSRP